MTDYHLVKEKEKRKVSDSSETREKKVLKMKVTADSKRDPKFSKLLSMSLGCKITLINAGKIVVCFKKE